MGNNPIKSQKWLTGMITSFAGESKHILDEKGRIAIPARYRRWLSDDHQAYAFVVTKGSDPCLVAYPYIEWDRLSEKLMQLSQFKKKNRAFVRAISRNSVRLKCDKQGRISIPRMLLDFAGIQKEVMIIGTLNCLELWDPKVLENHKESQIPLDDDYFEDLGSEVF